MEEERIAKALDRIEAAANRIEAVVSSASPPRADPGLSQRHEYLRKEAWAALSELDSLIETLES